MVKSLFQMTHIFFAHRRKSAFYDLFCFRERDLFRLIRHKRHIHVVHVEFLHAKRAFAQCHITVHCRQETVNGFDQIVVDFRRNISRRERGSKRRRIFSYVRIEFRFFHIRAVSRRQRILKLIIDLIQCLKCLFPHPAVTALHKSAKPPVRQFHFFSIFIPDRSKLHVRVIEHGKNIIRRSCHFIRLCKDLLPGSGQRVLLSPPYPVDQKPVFFKLWIFL